MMIAIIKNRIFPNDWKKLLFGPYYNGVVQTICWVTPAYLAFLALHSVITNELVVFVIVCCMLAAVATWVFLKKPWLLGSDIHDIQEDFLQTFQRKKSDKQISIELNAEA